MDKFIKRSTSINPPENERKNCPVNGVISICRVRRIEPRVDENAWSSEVVSGKKPEAREADMAREYTYQEQWRRDVSPP